MFLNIVVNIIIVFAVIVFFFVAIVLNGITKTPENVELPEQCSSCDSLSCSIKFDRKEKTKETIEEFYKNCAESEEK